MPEKQTVDGFLAALPDGELDKAKGDPTKR